MSCVPVLFLHASKLKNLDITAEHETAKFQFRYSESEICNTALENLMENSL